MLVEKDTEYCVKVARVYFKILAPFSSSCEMLLCSIGGVRSLRHSIMLWMRHSIMLIVYGTSVSVRLPSSLSLSLPPIRVGLLVMYFRCSFSSSEILKDVFFASNVIRHIQVGRNYRVWGPFYFPISSPFFLPTPSRVYFDLTKACISVSVFLAIANSRYEIPCFSFPAFFFPIASSILAAIPMIRCQVVRLFDASFCYCIGFDPLCTPSLLTFCVHSRNVWPFAIPILF
jgi:hypothetical protein